VRLEPCCAVNLRLREALCELIDRANRDIPLSDLFVTFLCGHLEPNQELLDWCEARGLEVERNTDREFIFRTAQAVSCNGDSEDCRPGEFVELLFEL
jgi:hypothetical protein